MIGEKGLLTEGLFLDKDVSDYLTFFSQNVLDMYYSIILFFIYLYFFLVEDA